MSNVAAFTDQVVKSKALRDQVAQLAAQADDKFLSKLVKVAKDVGVELSEDDAKVFAVAAFGGADVKSAVGKRGQLSDAALDGVSGGAGQVFRLALGRAAFQIDRAFLDRPAVRQTIDRLTVSGFDFRGAFPGDSPCW